MSRTSLLLVDDNATYLQILTDFLETDYKAEVAVVGTGTGGEEGLARARALRPQVVLLDLAMPNLTGLKVIPRLRHMLPKVGVIALTLLDPNSYRQAALDAGADAFVCKTDIASDLLPAIRRVAQARATRQTAVKQRARKQRGR